jgi:hypothetical protein
LVSLRQFWLGSGNFTKAVAAKISQLPQLARLNLDCQSVEEDALASLAKAPALRILTMRTKDAVLRLSELPHLQSLGYLRIGEKLTPEQMTSLQTALPNCRILSAYRDPNDEGGGWE